MLLLLLPVVLAAYSIGAFDRPETTATLAPTEFAPTAVGEVEVRGLGSDVETNLEDLGLAGDLA